MKNRMPKRFLGVLVRQSLMILFDIIAINVSYIFVCALTLDGEWSGVLKDLMIRSVPVTVATIVLFAVFGIYNSMWKYAGSRELLQSLMAVAFSSIVSYAFDKFALAFGYITVEFEPIGYICYMFFIAAFVCGFRLVYRAFRSKMSRRSLTFLGSKDDKRIMIVGAGDMGMIIVKEFEINNYKKGRPVVIVDDDHKKHGQKLRGIPVKGGCDKIPEIAEWYRVNEIIFCIPSASPERRKEIMEIAMSTDCTLKISPSIIEMNDAGAKEKKVRDVEISDLLSRPEVHLSTETCGYISGKTVMITGCGSIGSEICRQVAKLSPKRIVLFDIYENTAFLTKTKLDAKYDGEIPIDIRIGSVQDVDRLNEVFDEFCPNVVFHAAAHKHVPLMESSPCEAVKNNIFGTYNTAQAALEHKAEKFIILSTDKAVNPANVMGATKRVTELIIQYFNRKSDSTVFAAVRFGNVLGSDGSVIPIFKDQIKHGGPVTVTDKNMTRYFMTIPEAAQLVVQAGNIAKGGEVFVLDMGEPVKILSLAENIIRLSGYIPYQEIDICFTGLRPGEKLYEELSMDEELENRKMTANNKIFVTPMISFDDRELENALDKLRNASEENVRELLKTVVPNFKESKYYSC